LKEARNTAGLGPHSEHHTHTHTHTHTLSLSLSDGLQSLHSHTWTSEKG